MTCAEFESRLSAYLDGELSHWTRWKVELHTRHCGECADCLRDLEDVDFLVMDSVTARPEPAHLTYSVMARLPAMPPAWKRRAFRPVLAGAALACAQVLALGGAYFWGFNQAGTGAGAGDTPGRLPATSVGGGVTFAGSNPGASLSAPKSLGGGAVPVALTGRGLPALSSVTNSPVPATLSTPRTSGIRMGPVWGMHRFDGLTGLSNAAAGGSSVPLGTSVRSDVRSSENRASRPIARTPRGAATLTAVGAH